MRIPLSRLRASSYSIFVAISELLCFISKHCVSQRSGYLLLPLFLFFYAANAQNNVGVNLSTGTAHVSIPVYTMVRGGVAVPVSLEYDAKGLRIGEIEGLVGSGWQLNAGGAITRNLRDLPDDIKADQSSNARVGWMFNTNATKINSFLLSMIIILPHVRMRGQILIIYWLIFQIILIWNQTSSMFRRRD